MQIFTRRRKDVTYFASKVKVNHEKKKKKTEQKNQNKILESQK